MFSKKSQNSNLILNKAEPLIFNQHNTQDLIKTRKINISNNFSISYKKPIQFLEAQFQYLYDEKGKKYLDCINNISHVGHCHPQIHQELVKQNEFLEYAKVFNNYYGSSKTPIINKL